MEGWGRELVNHWGRGLVAFLLAKKPLNPVPNGSPLLILEVYFFSLNNRIANQFLTF